MGGAIKTIKLELDSISIQFFQIIHFKVSSLAISSKHSELCNCNFS